MSHYEYIYLLFVLIQTGFLIWYAIETWKIRKSAAEQTATIGKQYAEMAKQSKLLADQLAMNTEALAREDQRARDVLASEERRAIEAKEEALRREQQQADAVFDLAPIASSNGQLTLHVHSIKENVVFTEYRANAKIHVQSATPPNKDKFLLFVPNHIAVVYFGIMYKTKLGDVLGQTFEINTASGDYKLLKDYDISKLPVYRGN